MRIVLNRKEELPNFGFSHPVNNNITWEWHSNDIYQSFIGINAIREVCLYATVPVSYTAFTAIYGPCLDKLQELFLAGMIESKDKEKYIEVLNANGSHKTIEEHLLYEENLRERINLLVAENKKIKGKL